MGRSISAADRDRRTTRRLSGGSLRVLQRVGGFDDTYPLPASRWTYIGNPVNGYVYKDLKLIERPGVERHPQGRERSSRCWAEGQGSATRSGRIRTR